MGYQLPELPRFMEKAFQGLAYWMGYRASYFPGNSWTPTTHLHVHGKIDCAAYCDARYKT